MIEGVHVGEVREPHVVELSAHAVAILRRVVAPAVLQHPKQPRHVGFMPESSSASEATAARWFYARESSRR